MNSIALFGGSFDPPHLGHVAIVEEALKQLDVKKVVIVPTYLNPFKSTSYASAELRFKWLKTIFSDLDKVEISDFEIRQNRAVSSIETVRHLSRETEKIYFIIGADNLESLSRWHRYDELDKMVTWVVATRDEIDIPSRFITLDVSRPVSSTQLRDQKRHHQLPLSVAKEIIQTYKETHAKKN